MASVGFLIQEVAAQAGITREVFANIGGTAVSDLTSNPAYPDSPTTAEVLTNSFDCPVDTLDNYGQRLRALITAPTTGSYTFWIASDDNGQLWLSTDSTPANRRMIASVNTWTSWKQWNKEANQQSAPVSLVGGQKYYIEALSKEGGGGDNLTVRWQLPNGTIEEPIPASRCTPVGVGPPVFLQQPVGPTVIEGNNAAFTVRIGQSFGATLQWQRNGANIPDATNTNYTVGPLALSDSGTTFRCVATNPYGTTSSTTVTLTVVSDTTPPTISSVGNLGDNQVITVVFSEPMGPTAAVATNYKVNNGITVLTAAFGADNRTIILGTTPLAANFTYTLTVDNVRDLASTPNTIAPNTQRTFSIVSRPLDISFLKPRPEPIGPSSRRGSLIISELMYHPTNRFDGRNIEFIEIYNTNPWFEELGGYRISGAIDFTFPSNYVLAARSYVVVAANPADVQSVYGIAGVLGPWFGTLQNGSGTLRLRNKRDAILFEMSYTGSPPYPAAADGAGHSLVLARPSFGESDPRAWAASDVIGGSPGASEGAGTNPYRTVMINEFLAHTDWPNVDYVELYNYSPSSLNIGGCILTDDPGTNKFLIPANTIIPANGFAVFFETNLPFALSAAGETIYFKNPQNTRVLDAVRFDAQENGVPTGRFPDGAPEFTRLQYTTPGTNNAPLKVADVVINEIMFDPVTSDPNDEYIELYNRGTNTVNLSGWRIRDAVSFNVANGTALPPGGYLVIAKNAAHLRANYSGLTAANCLGNFSSGLANGGERIELNMPDQITNTNGLGQLVTNTIHITVDAVTYRDGGRWGKWASGGGSSLELRDPRTDRRLAPDWADSDESGKSAWVTVETTGVMDNGYETASQLHITLMGAGECLIDNVEVIPSGGANLISNGTFESGTSGWVFQGNHNQTSWEQTEGFGSARSLHLRAVGRGDTGANRVRAQLSSALASGTTVTLRARVRWLKGNPNILLRLRGNWLEAPGYILTAHNLGTPGQANSAAATNVAPAITDVTHWPPLPANNQPALVTARVADPDGVSTLLLKYRIDPATNRTAVTMTNNGAGLFSAVIPGQPGGTMAAFHIQASDKLSPMIASSFPNDAPLRECVVRWGDTTIPGTLPTYRFWITQANVDRWSNEEKMSNNPKDVTFIYGTNRVVYNAGAWFHGSPYHSPGYNSPVGNSCDYDMYFPSDDRLLGETDINLFRPGNGGGDGTGQTEIQAYWFAQQFGLPFLLHRPVFVFVNGLRRETIFHDAQQPNGDYISQWYPNDANGELHKVQLGFEFGDTASGANESGYAAVGANLARYTTTGGAFKQARYRQTWPLRSASPAEQNNYTNLFALVNTVLTTAALNSDPYTITLTNAVDVEEWFKVHVTQHLYNNTDSFSYGGGQNAFVYKPEHDTWKLFLWDVDFAFGGNASDANLFGIGGADHGPRNDHAPFQRIYWQALIEAANGFMTSARSNPILDARYNGMVGAGGAVSSPQGIKDFIATKRNVILSQIAANQAPFAITSNGGADITTSQNLVTLTGTAPLEVRTIEVNGIDSILTWTTATAWSLRVALPPGTNALVLQGYDPHGTPVAGAIDTIKVNVTAPTAQPQDFIVMNEIMYDPAIPNAEYVELFNTSTNFSFDLSGWRFDGIDYSFPEGTIMQPRAFLLLAKDRSAFATAYGTGVVPFGVFAGNLQANGETLTLVKPGLTAATDLVIDKVRYQGTAPWSTNASGTGSSLQLIDARQDNSRPGNWFALFRTNVYSPAIVTPAHTNDGWQFVSVSGGVGPGIGGQQMRLIMYLDEAGDASAIVDDISVVAGTTPAVGYNYVRDGDFESLPLLETPALTNSWFIGTNYTNSAIVGNLTHGGTGALKLVCSSYASVFPRLIAQNLSPAPPANSTNTLSFWFWATNSAMNLNMRLFNSATVSVKTNINITYSPSNYVPPQIIVSGTNTLTPGTANQGTTNLPLIPPLWINEVQADNLSGLLDNAGDHDPWVEIYNAGTNTVSLTNLFLSADYASLTHWTFPAGSSIGPTQFLVVFCDGQVSQSTGNEFHTSFRLTGHTGSIALSRLYGGEPQVLDFMNYTAGLDHSYGSFPDGQPFARHEMYYVTPGATNNGTLPPVLVSINEWMADNLGVLADPADGDYEDWFELYNPGSNSVSLAGYFLTDNLTNKFKYEIPEGYSIPAFGHLLVWADNETGQNAPDRPDLHVNFSLAKSGEAIGLFTPDGIQIDAVTFGAQFTDISMGRFPDGAETILLLTNATPRTANYFPQDNAAPVLAPIGNRIVFEGEPLVFTAAATDANSPAQQLTWTLQNAPAGAAIDPMKGQFGWQPSELQGGNDFTMTVTVKDNGIPPLSDFQTFTVTVLKTNSRPTLVTSGNQTVNEGSPLVFTVHATDSDLPSQSVTFSLDTNGLPTGAAIDPTTGVFTWTPTEEQGPNVYGVTIRATDNGNPPLSDSALITIVVNESNTPPALAAIADQAITVGQTLTFTVQATDPDLPAQPLTFDFAGTVPAGVTIDATNGVFSWIANTVGTNVIAVRATDNGVPPLSDTRTFTVIVTASFRITSIGLSNDVVTLTWNAAADAHYRVEYKNSLADADWLPLTTNITAAGTNASASDRIETNRQRIYRIALQP